MMVDKKKVRDQIASTRLHIEEEIRRKRKAEVITVHIRLPFDTVA